MRRSPTQTKVSSKDEKLNTYNDDDENNWEQNLMLPIGGIK